MRRQLLVAACGLLAGSAVLVVADACTIVNGLTVPEDAAATIDAGDAVVESGPIDPCDHARPPPKPSTADLPGDLTITVVARRFGVGSGDAGAPAGFDLDNACSCPPAVAETCVGRKDHCDSVGGRDNATGSLFNALLSFPTAKQLDFEDRVNSAVLAGKNTIMVRVTGFNGTANDPAVVVSVYAALGLLDGAGNYMTPQFTEDERWALDDRQFPITGSVPKATATGYVANGKLVADLPSISIDLSDSFSIALTGGVLQADIALTGNAGKPTITRGVMAGRWPIADILRVAGQVRLEDGGKAVCDTPLAYITIKDQVCQEADIVADRARDKKGAACDALSAAVVFEAAPASLGPIKPSTPATNCPDATPDDCTKEGGP
jgi:hypothetical protein